MIEEDEDIAVVVPTEESGRVEDKATVTDSERVDLGPSGDATISSRDDLQRSPDNLPGSPARSPDLGAFSQISDDLYELPRSLPPASSPQGDVGVEQFPSSYDAISVIEGSSNDAEIVDAMEAPIAGSLVATVAAVANSLTSEVVTVASRVAAHMSRPSPSPTASSYRLLRGSASATPAPRGSSSPAFEMIKSTPSASPSRLHTPFSPNVSLSFIPVSESAASPAKERILLSTGPPSVGFQRKGHELPAKVFIAVPEEIIDTKPEVRSHRNRASVVLDISRRRRDALIVRGVYDPHRDDWIPIRGARRLKGKAKVEDELGHLPRAKNLRVGPPEAIADRFRQRPGPAMLEPFATVLAPGSLLNRLGEYECGWNGCEAVLNSENNLAKHVRIREHAVDGAVQVEEGRDVLILYQCLWDGCDGPCFDSVQELSQHLTGQHISLWLHCPYGTCDLRSRNLSHLHRHVSKQHDEDEEPRGRVDRPFRPPLRELPPLPNKITTSQLVTAQMRPSNVRTPYRQEWVRNKVQKGCVAPEDAEIRIVHPPHMLQPLEGSVPVESGTSTPIPPKVVATNGTASSRQGKRSRANMWQSPRKKSKLSTVTNAPHERLEVYVEIPYTRPFRRPGQKVKEPPELPDVD